MGYRLGFSSQAEEIGETRLEVRGSIPDWLRGTLLRPAPALFEIGSERYRHWFDGLSKLHRFSVADGSITYSSRFLNSQAYSTARAKGRITHREFATSPYRSYLRRITAPATDNGVVNVMQVDDTFLAITETLKVQEIRLQNLGTVGHFWYGGAPSGFTMPAHPHYDPTTHEWITFVSTPVRSAYKVFRVPPGTRRGELIASVPATEPAYMHSFALTPSFVVLVESPFVVRPIKLGLSGRPFIENYEWKPERPTRLRVIDRRDGSLANVYETEPFFCFHQVNAFEDPAEITIDLIAFPDVGIIRDLYLDRLRAEGSRLSLGEVRRYRLGRDSDQVTYDVMCSERAEFPRINLWRNALGYRFMFAAGTRADPSDDFVNQLFKLDLQSGSVTPWFQDGCYPGEPVFVSRSPERDEDEGVILALVLNGGRGNSFLLVLDGASFSELARAELPEAVPFGFHGQFFDVAGADGDRRLTPFGTRHQGSPNG